MKTITVKGLGRISVKPNLIVVSMGLDTEGKEYDATIETAAEKLEVLNGSLEAIGFEKASLKTTNFFVRPNYESVRDKNGKYTNVFKGYVCTQNLKLEFDFDMKTLGKVLAAISSSTSMPEFSISFTVKDPKAVSQELLGSAAKNAKEKASVLCAASGVMLGELASIDYTWGEINVYSNTQYKLQSRCMVKEKSSLANINIEPDDINVSDTATFVWEIK